MRYIPILAGAPWAHAVDESLRRRPTLRSAAALLIALALGSACSSGSGHATTTTAAPHPRTAAIPTREAGRFELGPCAPPLAGQARISCGTLNISGAAPARIAVAIVHAADKPASADPIVFLHGGPGGSAVTDAADLFATNVMSLHRDVIVFDQRGAGLSTPAYQCHVDRPNKAQVVAHTDNDAGILAIQRRANEDCASQLRAKGLDPDGLSTERSARDADALRRTLHIQTWNVYGSSYGTRIALAMMRDDPTSIRSVILDSTDPPDHSAFDPNRSVPGFDALFDACAANPNCDQRTPHLRTDWLQLLAQLARHPRAVTVPVSPPTKVLMNPARAAAGLSVALQDTDLIPQMPKVIATRDLVTLATQAARTVPDDGQPDVLAASQSVLCNEDLEVPHHSAAAPESGGFPTESAFAHECDGWPTAGRPNGVSTASAVPTLLLSGQFDTNTPPMWSAETAQTLEHSYRYTIPGLTHQVLMTDDNCPLEIAISFLTTPTTRPDSSCISQEQSFADG